MFLHKVLREHPTVLQTVDRLLKMIPALRPKTLRLSGSKALSLPVSIVPTLTGFKETGALTEHELHTLLSSLK